MRRPRPIHEIEHLADWLQAIQETMGEADDVACVVLYRSELATLLGALWALERGPAPHREWAALHPIPPVPVGTTGRMLDPRDRGPEGTGPFIRGMTRQEFENIYGPGSFNPPAAAAPTLPTELEDLAWEGIDRMTEEELLAGLEGLCGPLEPKGPVVQPRGQKHYGRGRQGPVGAPPSSASASGRPSCSPSFGLRDSTDDTPSTDHDEEPEGI